MSSDLSEPFDQLALAQQLADLAKRLIGWHVLNDRFQPDWGEVIVGRVPADWPVALPVPPGGQVLGSIAHRPNGRLTQGYVLLQAQGVDVITFYDRELPARGWLAPPPMGPPPDMGFTGSERTRTYYYSENGPYLSVSVITSGPDREVRVGLHQGSMPSARTFAALRAGQRPTRPGDGLIPRLQPPKDVTLQARSGGASKAEWYSVSEASTGLTPTELEEHFGRQLQAARWTLQSRDAGPYAAVSTWLLQEGNTPWWGYMLVVASPAPDRRLLTVRIQRLEPNAGLSNV